MRMLVILGLLSAVVGCVPVPVAPVPIPLVTVRCVYPVITPVPETKELQRKGGINASLAPNEFVCVDSVETTTREIPRNPFDFNESYSLVAYINSGAGGSPEDYKLVETTETPVYAVQPGKLSFRVKVNNQMPRVFRGAGTVVLYNFGGKNTSVSSKEYEELTNLIVPPRTEQEVMIYGPSFENIPSNTTLGIFLYDVVTKTDNAGNIKEKQNFEWYYHYETQLKETTKEVVKKRGWARK